MSNMIKRIIVGAIGIPFLVWVILHGGYGFLFFTMIISALAQWEFYKTARIKGYQPIEWLGIGFGLLYLASVAPICIDKPPMEPIATLPTEFIIGAMVLIAFIMEVFRSRSTALANAMTTVGGFLYIPFSIGFLHHINSFFIEESHLGGKMFIVILFAGIWLCDSAAYFTGKFMGKHKLLERVSPKKTWEGAIGGFVFAIAGVYGLSQWLIEPHFSTTFIILTGVLIGTIGQIGDLFESLIKRDAQVKDSSHIIPGHGGMLDRFDSLLFVAPALWLLLTLFEKMELKIFVY